MLVEVAADLSAYAKGWLIMRQSNVHLFENQLRTLGALGAIWYDQSV